MYKRIRSIGHFGKHHNTLCLSPQILHEILHEDCFVFSWDHCKFQEKLDTMLMQNLEGQTRSIMVFSEVAYW